MRLYSIIVFVICFSLLTSAVYGLQPRVVSPKPQTAIFGSAFKSDLIELKFVEGSGIRLRDGTLVTLTRTDISTVTQFLASYPTIEINRMFYMTSEDQLTQDKIRGEARSGKELADLNLWYECHLPADVDPQTFVDGLNALDLVEIAYPYVIPEQAVYKVEKSDLRETPDFSELQGYLYASPVGVNAAFAWDLEGGYGEDMKWIDLENGWNWEHEDMPEPFHQWGGQPYGDHGIAVVGEVSGIHNDYGIDGIAPAAQVGSVSWDSGVAAGIYNAYQHLDEGDVLLLEVQRAGPRYNFQTRDDQLGYIAVEWWQADFDAIQTATSNGVLCTEAAGNGAEDFDDSIYQGLFDRNVRDSGAIMCGAATGIGLRKEGFSNYGSRLDSFGWGSGVTTTGYGDLQGGDDQNEWYTNTFSGTSSASPICTGSVLCIQGILKAMDEELLTPLEMRSLLTETGSPQQSDPTLYIGTRPNLYEALRQLMDTGGVNGYITNLETGEPILNATVELIYPDVITNIDYSDVDGFYRFQEEYFPIEYILRVTCHGYETYEESVTIPAEETLALNIELNRTEGMSNISGLIQSTNGEALTATLRFYEPNSNFDLLLNEISSDSTDGRFTLDIPACSYDIRTVVEFPFPMRQEFELTIGADSPIELSYTLSPAQILLVDDDEGDRYEEYYIDPLCSLNTNFYRWDAAENGILPTSEMVAEFDSPIIIWFTGDAVETALTSDEADLLIELLEQGYPLFLAGQNIAEYLGSHPFIEDYLQISYIESTEEASLLRSIADDEIGGQLNMFIRIRTEGGHTTQPSADVITPQESAEAIFQYFPGGLDQIGAIHNENAAMGYKLVFFSFGFEGIDEPGDRPTLNSPEEVLDAVLGWLDETVSVEPATESANLPGQSLLYGNVPNPFNPKTVISYDLSNKRSVSLSIYDIAGKLIKQWKYDQQSAGHYEVEWNGTDESSQSVASGVYFYQLKTDDFVQTRSMILLK